MNRLRRALSGLGLALLAVVATPAAAAFAVDCTADGAVCTTAVLDDSQLQLVLLAAGIVCMFLAGIFVLLLGGARRG